MSSAEDGAGDGELGRLIRREATRHAAPAALAARITDATRAAGELQARDVTGRATLPRWVHAALGFGAGAAAAWAVALAVGVVGVPQVAGDRDAEAVVASHVRSLMAAHLADVASSDHHTVKPWFAGKLDYAPPVVDLADHGLPLVGGRLDYLDGRAVAALVYRSGPHVVNLFVWPQAGRSAALAPRLQVQQGYNLVHWAEDGMQSWVVSDLNAAELQAFVALLRERGGSTASPATLR